MRPASESRVVLIGAVIAVVVTLLFALSLGAVLLVSRTTGDPDLVADTLPSSVSTLAPSPNAEMIGEAGGTQDQDSTPSPTAPSTPTGLASESSTSTATSPRPALPQPTSTTTPSLPPITSTPAPATPTILASTATVQLPTTAPTQTPAPSPSSTMNPTPTLTPVPPTATTDVASIEWPVFIPDGMTFAAADSWPFRVIAPDRENEPFLIFRNGPRWLLIRNQGSVRQPIPRSASTETRQIAGAPATVIKYAGGGFKIMLNRGGRNLQISGAELGDEDIARVIESLRQLSAEELRSRLTQEAAQHELGVTMLWPDYVPEGFELVPVETIAQIGQVAEGYRVSFKSGDGLLQVGGGSVEPPTFPGTEERIVVGSLTGVLRTSGRRYLLVVDAGAASNNVVPAFPAESNGAARRLPLVQKGRVFITAENIDRDQFDRVVDGLIVVRPNEFVSRSRGQSASALTYLWPTTLPPGYVIDLASVRTAWDDFVLQGGIPFFELTAIGPDQGAVSIKGGLEGTGEPFVVPEGPDVIREVVAIRGHSGSGAQTPDGSLLFWHESNWPYTLTSGSLTLAQLDAIGEGLETLNADEFFRRIE